jgi:hypothetical protein
MSDRIRRVALVLCKSGKFETGQGTCAAICLDQLGPVRNRPCHHAVDVFGKLAEEIVDSIGEHE